ncbi:MAG: VWA domain-containing protein [Saprospiraceae bacterium]
MNWISHIEWNNPWAFVLLLVIPIFLWYFRKSSKIPVAYLSYPTLEYLPKSNSLRLRIYRFLPFVSYCSLILFIIALARPQYILREEKIDAEGINIFLVLDLSSSMLSQDFEPNRLEVSKNVATDFLNKRSYDRIGIVGFAGEGYTQCPLTVDHLILNNLLKQLQCGRLEDGTAIGMGLATAINRLKEDSLTHSKVIILLTDGVNNAGDITPDLAAEMAKLYNIKIYSIGVGNNGEAYSPIGRNPNGDYVFGMVPVNIDEQLLTQISQSTGGKYYRATNLEQLKEIYSEIDRLEKNKITVQVFKRYSEEYRLFVLIGFILLITAYFLKRVLNPLMP